MTRTNRRSGTPPTSQSERSNLSAWHQSPILTGPVLNPRDRPARLLTASRSRVASTQSLSRDGHRARSIRRWIRRLDGPDLAASSRRPVAWFDAASDRCRTHVRRLGRPGRLFRAYQPAWGRFLSACSSVEFNPVGTTKTLLIARRACRPWTMFLGSCRGMHGHPVALSWQWRSGTTGASRPSVARLSTNRDHERTRPSGTEVPWPAEH